MRRYGHRERDSPCDFCFDEIILKTKRESSECEYYNPILNRDYWITNQIINWYDGRYVCIEFAIDIAEFRKLGEVLKTMLNKGL